MSIIYIFNYLYISQTGYTCPRTPVAASCLPPRPARHRAGQGTAGAASSTLSRPVHATRRKETKITYSDLYSTLGKKPIECTSSHRKPK